MKTFVVVLAAALFIMGVIIVDQAGEMRALRAEIAGLDDDYHYLNRQFLALKWPDLVRPFDRYVWEGKGTKRGNGFQPRGASSPEGEAGKQGKE